MIVSLIKRAIEVGPGGLPSRALASTVGRAGGFVNLEPLISLQSMVDPQRDKEKHRETAELLQSVRPQQLSDVAMRLGGSRFFSDIGRIWTNPRTGPIDKVEGTMTYPAAWAIGNLMRSPHFNAATNAVNQYWDLQPVTEHELGHAIDFNEDAPGHGLLQRLYRSTKRDLYSQLYAVPFAKLWHEARANVKSHRALREALANQPTELKRREAERVANLPAAYSTYIAGGIGEQYPPLGAPLFLGGVIGSKLYGLTRRRQILDELDKQEEERKKKEKEVPRKAANEQPYWYEEGPARQGTRALLGIGGMGLGSIAGALLASHYMTPGVSPQQSLDLQRQWQKWPVPIPFYPTGFKRSLLDTIYQAYKRPDIAIAGGLTGSLGGALAGQELGNAILGVPRSPEFPEEEKKKYAWAKNPSSAATGPRTTTNAFIQQPMSGQWQWQQGLDKGQVNTGIPAMMEQLNRYRYQNPNQTSQVQPRGGGLATPEGIMNSYAWKAGSDRIFEVMIELAEAMDAKG